MLSPRQTRILEYLRRDGDVEVEALAPLLGVTPQTVRRDLSVLVEAGLASRVHGGARRSVAPIATAYNERLMHNVAAKQSIARTVARMIPDGASIGLNIGTTTEHVSDALRLHRGLTVVTNNMNIAQKLRAIEGFTTMVVGGVVRPQDGAILGDRTIEGFASFKLDYAIVSASAFDDEGSILEHDLQEAAVTQAILKNARQSIFVADASKAQATASYRVCNAEMMDHIVMDARPSGVIGNLETFVNAGENV